MDQDSGYKNKATWIIIDQFRKDEDSYRYWKKKAEELSRKELLKELRLQIEDIENPLTEKATLYSDLLNFSLALVDWDKIVDILKEWDK